MATGTRKQLKSMPKTPEWRFLSSTSELKKDILVRIGGFFEYEVNRTEFPSLYAEHANGLLKKKSAKVVCDTAVDILRLRSIKVASMTAIQLSKKLMVMQPFHKDMETPVNTTSTSSSEDDQHVEKDTEAQMIHSDTSSSKSKDLLFDEPGNDETIGQVTMSTIDMEQRMSHMLDQKMSQMQLSMQKEREADNVRMRNEMKAALEECFANSFRLNMEENVMKVIEDTGQSVIDEMIENRKSDINQKVIEVTKETTQIITQGFNTTADQKRNVILVEVQEHADKLMQQMVHTRDGALEDVNEEAAQAISDVQSATEQSRASIRNEYDKLMSQANESTAPVTPVKPVLKPSSRFKDVDVANIGSMHATPAPSYAMGRESNKFSTPYKRNPYEKQPYAQASSQNEWQNSHHAVSGFHKHFRARMQNDNHILNFYQQLFVQGPKYGIHIKNLKEVYPNNDLCPPSYSQAARDDMARTIYQKMQDEDCVSIGYSKAQRIIEQYAHISDGFKVLEQLLRFVHPNLQQVTANTYEVPKLSQCKGDIYEYGALIMNYILRQEISLRKYTLQEQSIMFLNNMDEKRYFDAKNRALAEIRQTSSNDGTFDPNLNIESLPTTISQYQMQISGNDYEENRKNKFRTGGAFIRSIFSNSDDEKYKSTEDEDEPWIRAMGARKDYPRKEYPKRRFYRKDNAQNGNNFNSMRQCTACGRWGCQESKCQFVAKVQLAVNYIRKHSEKTAKLAEEYLRTNSRRTKMSTIRTLTSFASNGQQSQVESMRDEDLLQQFDVEIPMEAIDSSGNNDE